MQDIVGVRFKCMSCDFEDYDLCENCYTNGEHSHHGDLFLRLDDPYPYPPGEIDFGENIFALY